MSFSQYFASFSSKLSKQQKNRAQKLKNKTKQKKITSLEKQFDKLLFQIFSFKFLDAITDAVARDQPQFRAVFEEDITFKWGGPGIKCYFQKAIK